MKYLYWRSCQSRKGQGVEEVMVWGVGLGGRALGVRVWVLNNKEQIQYSPDCPGKKSMQIRQQETWKRNVSLWPSECWCTCVKIVTSWEGGETRKCRGWGLLMWRWGLGSGVDRRRGSSITSSIQHCNSSLGEIVWSVGMGECLSLIKSYKKRQPLRYLNNTLIQLVHQRRDVVYQPHMSQTPLNQIRVGRNGLITTAAFVHARQTAAPIV